jgi:hypothetical protein
MVTSEEELKVEVECVHSKFDELCVQYVIIIHHTEKWTS